MTAEDKLAEEQAELGREIAVQELDDDALDTVSGGGSETDCYGTRDCDQNFKNARYEGWFHPNGENMGGKLNGFARMDFRESSETPDIEKLLRESTRKSSESPKAR